MKQEMMAWQWHQLDITQIICTSLQTDNHASTYHPTNYYYIHLTAFFPDNLGKLTPER